MSGACQQHISAYRLTAKQTEDLVRDTLVRRDPPRQSQCEVLLLTRDNDPAARGGCTPGFVAAADVQRFANKPASAGVTVLQPFRRPAVCHPLRHPLLAELLQPPHDLAL